MPRELRDLVHQYALATDSRVYDCYLIENASPFDGCEELVMIPYCMHEPHLAHEACETFFAHNATCAEPCHIREILGSRSLPNNGGPPLNFMVWIQNITVDIRSMTYITDGHCGDEMRVLLACPNLCRLTVEILRTDHGGGQKELADALVAIAKVCRELGNKIGDGLKITHVGWEQGCEVEDLTWVMEASAGTDLKMDQLRTAFAMAALTE